MSWDDAKAAFSLYWEAHCEAQRHLLAASAYGKDVVDDQPGETPQVRMTFLHLGAPAQTTIPLNPGFIDSRFEYAAETVIGTVTLTATVPLGASVRWLYEHVITIGQSVTIDLHPGREPRQHHGNAERPPQQQLRHRHHAALMQSEYQCPKCGEKVARHLLLAHAMQFHGVKAIVVRK